MFSKLPSTSSFTTSTNEGKRTQNSDNQNSNYINHKQMDIFTMYNILQLQEFSSIEIHDTAQCILRHKRKLADNIIHNAELNESDSTEMIDHETVQKFLLSRFQDYEKIIAEYKEQSGAMNDFETSEEKQKLMNEYAFEQASLFLNIFRPVATLSASPSKEATMNDDIEEKNRNESILIPPNTHPQYLQIHISDFERHLLDIASNISQRELDVLIPLTVSMLFIGSSVGVINPVMPFVVSNCTYEKF